MFLLAEVPLAEVLLFDFLPVVEEEMVLVVSGLLGKREKIPPGSVTSEGEEGVAVLWRFAWVLVLLEPFLFDLLDWGASVVVLLVFADVPVC